jgi:lipoate-protein ligase A
MWRLIEDGLCGGALNMATDMALLRAFAEGRGTPTVRLYGWDRPTLSLGYAQQLEADFDGAVLARCGIPVVRRPTGGRAVLHGRELTYCITVPVPHPMFPSNLKGAFRVVSDILLVFAASLGVRGAEAQIPRPASRGDKERRSPLCFSALNHFEIAVGGKKLVGSAQRRTPLAFLQHGSILLNLDPEWERLRDILKNPQAPDGADDFLRGSRTTLSEAVGRPVSFVEAAHALRDAFARAAAEPLISAPLTEWEAQCRDRGAATAVDFGVTG